MSAAQVFVNDVLQKRETSRTLPSKHPDRIHDMIHSAPNGRTGAKSAVIEGLARLQAVFPLEERILHAEATVRATYAEVLRHWLRGVPPATATFDQGTLTALVKMDAVVADTHGIGCYPFSAYHTGIRVTLPGGTVNAMCAIDALAIARLARARAHIDAACLTCGTSIALHVEENGGLDHDQVELAQVVWQYVDDTHTSASHGLCRRILFLCRNCPAPQTGELFTLPQAAAIGNAFFRFQSTLLAAHAGPEA